MCVMALGLIGGLVSAVGSMASGAAQANAANAQAAAYDRQAAAERIQANYNADRQRDKSIKLISSQRAAFGASGVDMSSGSPLDVIADTTRETELDVSAIRWNGEIKAQNFEMQAGASRAKASAAQTGGLFGAISPLIKGFGGDFGGSGATAFDTGD
jgi:hypothetical protein